ncbi:MAG: Glutamyl-tRNA(Gln) amidotransferase subunit A [Eubacteriales bacterium SKADARSKE-1]|nr:Glutamyl-tRNA(Gln) amidotransferase subunit A [Eubacteriales bacterium SKADARSKE-1]
MSENISKIKQIHKLLKTKQISCKELTSKYLDAIDKYNNTLGAYIKVTDELALNAAEKVDEKVKKGSELLPLEGIPVTLKDNISTNGIETTCCSKMLENYIPPFDATCWDIIKSQNGILLGKANMDEFAMGCSCETSRFCKTSNPHDLSRVPGGSSGGCSCAVSANLAAYALGSDTGGSIRQPASFCGIVGFKPTYGSISRYGLLALASSLDQIGPMATSVEDASIIYDALSIKDEKDSTCFGNVNGPTQIHLNKDINGMKIGLPKQYLEGINKDVSDSIFKAIKVYESLGAKIVPLDMPDIKYSLPIYYILVCSEAFSNFARLDGIRYGHRTNSYTNLEEFFSNSREEALGEDVKRRILLGTYVLSGKNYEHYYKKALKIRETIFETFEKAFKECDIILSSTVPQTAFLHNFKPEDQMEAYMTDICTVPANIAGIPAISIPCGTDSNNLPIGMQLIGNSFCESKILNAAYKFEQATFAKNHKSINMGVNL